MSCSKSTGFVRCQLEACPFALCNVRFHAIAAQSNRRNTLNCANLCQEFDARELWHAEVDDEQVEGIPFRRDYCLCCVRYRRYFKATPAVLSRTQNIATEPMA